MNQTTNQNTLYRAQTPRTTEPVTIGGWYDHDDGTVGLYRWTSGQLHLVRTVASWADVAVETAQKRRSTK